MTAARTANADIGALVARTLPFALYMVILVTAPLVADAVPALDGRWLYPVKVATVAVALVLLWRQFGELKTQRLGLGGTLLAVAGGVAVFLAWINLDLPWLSIAADRAGYVPLAADGAVDWRLALPRLAGAALVVPVMEELFWRSLVMRWLDRRDFLAAPAGAVSLRALLISSLVFGLEHYLWFAGILAGLVYGQLYRRSGNLWSPIIAHAVTNGLLGVWVLWSGQWQFW